MERLSGRCSGRPGRRARFGPGRPPPGRRRRRLPRRRRTGRDVRRLPGRMSLRACLRPDRHLLLGVCAERKRKVERFVRLEDPARVEDDEEVLAVADEAAADDRARDRPRQRREPVRTEREGAEHLVHRETGQPSADAHDERAARLGTRRRGRRDAGRQPEAAREVDDRQDAVAIADDALDERGAAGCANGGPVGNDLLDVVARDAPVEPERADDEDVPARPGRPRHTGRRVPGRPHGRPARRRGSIRRVGARVRRRAGRRPVGMRWVSLFEAGRHRKWARRRLSIALGPGSARRAVRASGRLLA